jgi:hypothetical protein
MRKRRSLGVPRVEGGIYLERDEQNRVKVGFSVNPIKRHPALQTGNADLLQMFRIYFMATEHDERFLHQELAAWRVKSRKRGEWYRPDPYFWATLTSIAKKMQWSRVDIGFDQPDLPFE